MSVMISFPYEDPALRSLEIEDSRFNREYHLKKTNPVADVREAVLQALQNPHGTAPVDTMIEPGKKIALIVDDATRPTPTAEILEILVEKLLKKGALVEDMEVIFALGSHRAMTEAEIKVKLGDLYGKIPCRNPQLTSPEEIRKIGTTSDGVDFYIDAHVYEADLRIGLGSIVPHGAAGWSGGAKIILPGVTTEDTVKYFHFTHGLNGENLTGVEDNPVRLCMEDWVGIVGLDFIINAVLTPDHQCAGIVAGHYIEAHRVGVELAKEVYSVSFQEQSEIVFAVSSTHDNNFWQGTKGIFCSEKLVKDGGTLVLVSPMPEGVGEHPLYPERINQDDNQALIREIIAGRGEDIPDPISLAPAAVLHNVSRRIRLAVVSPGLSQELAEAADMEKFPDLATAGDVLLKRYESGRISTVHSSDIAFLTSGEN